MLVFKENGTEAGTQNSVLLRGYFIDGKIFLKYSKTVLRNFRNQQFK